MEHNKEVKYIRVCNDAYGWLVLSNTSRLEL